MKGRVCLFYICLILFAFLGCSGPKLEKYQPRAKVSLSGSFLTESPDEIGFPVKVVFAIDSSLSMGDTELGYEVGSDPNYLRIEAVRNFINQYNTNDNVSFEVLLWSSSVFSYTRTISGQRGFTKDIDELNRVLDGASVDTTTDYLGTLNAIYTDIQRDINRSVEENLIRTRYIVVFLSDGMSNAQGTTQSESSIYSSVKAIAEMVERNGVGGFDFHTFLLLGMFGPGAEGENAQSYAESVLQGMADRGDGQFTLFENAESIDFLNIVDMRLTVEYKIKYMLAYNYNVKPGLDLVFVDSDGDGLSDIAEENDYNTDPLVKDTDGDGLSDFFEIKVSSPGREVNPLIPDSPCDTMDVYPDSDLDGLNDCEEYVKGTSRRIADTDNDGIPDGIEFFTGTNPLEDQTTKDSDFDGAVDWLEVQQHTNVTSNDPVIRLNYNYKYDIQDGGLVQIEQGEEMQSYVRQYNFNISNIDIMNTEEYILPDGEQWSEGSNLIRFYIAQVPEDTPDLPPIFRMAEVMVNFNKDAGKNIILTPADFVLVQ